MLNRLARLSRPGYILLKYKLQVVASFSTVNMEVGCHIVDSLGTSSCASPPAPPQASAALGTSEAATTSLAMHGDE